MDISRRSFLTALGALGGWVGLDVTTAWARPLLYRQTDRSLATAIDLSIRNIARDGLNNFFPAPFEIALLRQRADLREAVFARASEILAAQDFQSKDFSKLELIEFPKREYGARRICAITEPMDGVAYLALVLQAAEAIERNRISTRERVVHSFRYRPARMSGTLFDDAFSYVSFLKESRRRRGASDVVASCDIANFFGSISPSTVGAALVEADVPQFTADSIVDLLTFWSAQGAVGLPVGPNASKILAEAVLCRADRSLQRAGIEFVRYVDDFRLVAPDRTMAERHVRILSDILAENGLALNINKTKFIEPRSGSSNVLKRVAATYQQDAPPRQFKAPTPQELKRFRKRTNYRPNPSLFLEGDLRSARSLRKAMRMALCTGQPDYVRALPAILDRYPEFSRYATLGLSYAAGLISERTRRTISRYAADAILNKRTPKFVRLDFISLLGERGFQHRKALLAYARTADPRGLEFRAALDALTKSGGIPASLSSRYGAADRWGRRALVNAGSRPGPRADDPDPFLRIQA